VRIGFAGARKQVHGMRHNTPRSRLQARKAVSYSQHPIGAIFACRYHRIGKSASPHLRTMQADQSWIALVAVHFVGRSNLSHRITNIADLEKLVQGREFGASE